MAKFKHEQTVYGKVNAYYWGSWQQSDVPTVLGVNPRCSHNLREWFNINDKIRIRRKETDRDDIPTYEIDIRRDGEWHGSACVPEDFLSETPIKIKKPTQKKPRGVKK